MSTRGLLSLYSGPGGLDLGFERAGFTIDLAIDKSPDSIATYNHNRPTSSVGQIADISTITVKELDALARSPVEPAGLIGGPPCQSFSRGNRSPQDEDPRHQLPLKFARLLGELNRRRPVPFFMFENVPDLASRAHNGHFRDILLALEDAGFSVSHTVLNAADFGVPQNRRRLIVVGINTAVFPGRKWIAPLPETRPEAVSVSVRTAIEGLPEPVHYRRGLDREGIPVHRNHWCMSPKSHKFSTVGALRPGLTRSRSFKTLAWDLPSITVAYGHREVHVHPDCQRRLSVFEAMRLQGFPDCYELLGTMSSQITQVSDAVPPPLGEAVARSIAAQIRS